jgi:hypothetical protein
MPPFFVLPDSTVESVISASPAYDALIISDFRLFLKAVWLAVEVEC